MKFALTIVITVLALSMFFLKREQKIMVLWFSLMCLSSQALELKAIGVLLNVPTCFFLSELGNIRSSLRHYNRPWLIFILSVIIIATVILYFSSPHLFNDDGVKNALSIIVFELIRKYFFLLYALVCVTGWGTIESLIKVTRFAIIILTFFGIWDLVAGHSVYNDFLFGGQDLSERDTRILLSDNMQGGRWRIRSLFKFSFDYGFTCLLSLLLGLLGLKKGIVPKRHCWIILLCSFFGIIICGCRSVWISGVVAIALFIMYAHSFWKGSFILFLISGLTILLYNTIPQVQDFFALAESAFEKETQYGSSLGQRQRSYEAVFFYWQENPVFGYGKDYFVIDLGYDDEELVNKDLAGLEGVMMNLLIERGLIGVVAYLIFYMVLLLQVYKFRYIDRDVVACALAILLAYLLFANFTGELGSVPRTLFLMGALLKILFLSEEKNKSIELEPIET